METACCYCCEYCDRGHVAPCPRGCDGFVDQPLRDVTAQLRRLNEKLRAPSGSTATNRKD